MINETNATPQQPVNTVVDEIVLSQLPPLEPWQSFLFIALGSLFLAKIIEFAGSRLVRRIISHTNKSIDDIAFREISAPIYTTVAIAGIYIATLSVGLSGRADFLLQSMALTLIISIWSWAFIRIGNQFFERMKQAEKHYEFAHIFDNIWTLLVSVIAIFALLGVWRIDITPLLASAGVAGVVIGFAAKDTVANLFGGVALYFDDTYKVGDYIVLESGDKGTVVDIGIRSTTIVTRDEVMIQIPNAVLNSARVINQSGPQERKRIRVAIGVAYGTDLDRFEELVLNVADEEDLVLDHPSPRMRFREFGDSALQYELLCWVETPTRQVKTTHRLNKQIYNTLNEANITIPFPQRSIHMEGDDSTVIQRQQAMEHDVHPDDS